MLFDYIPTTSAPLSQPNPSTSFANKPPPADLKLIETDQNSSLIIGTTKTLLDQKELQENNQRNKSKDQLTIASHNGKSHQEQKRRSPRSVSFKQRTFALYANGMSDWDSTDSETGVAETNASYSEPEMYQTRSWGEDEEENKTVSLALLFQRGWFVHIVLKDKSVCQSNLIVWVQFLFPALSKGWKEFGED